MIRREKQIDKRNQFVYINKQIAEELNGFLKEDIIVENKFGDFSD